MSSFHLLLGFTSGPSPSGFPIKTLHAFLSSPKSFPCCPPHSLVFKHPNIIRRSGQIVKLPSRAHGVRSDFRIYTPLQTNQYREGLFPKSNAIGARAVRSPSRGASVKNAYSRNSMPSIRLHGVVHR